MIYMILINDKFVARERAFVDIEDRAFQFGDGVYEVIRFYDKKFFKMAEHMKRLERSATEIKLNLPYSINEIEKNLTKLMTDCEEQSGNIYLQITRGATDRVHLFPENTNPDLYAYAMPFERPTENIKNGVKAHLTEDIRWNRCDIKSLNLLANVLAKQEAKENGCFESILHRDNIVTEGSSTNMFIVKDDIIYTHPANNFILNGITRIVVIETIKQNNMQIKEETFSVEDLLNADEVFLTSTTSEVTPIIQVDEAVISDGTPGPVTKKLIRLFENKIGVN